MTLMATLSNLRFRKNLLNTNRAKPGIHPQISNYPRRHRHHSNFAFDVTPNDLVTAIITEKGVARAPYAESLKAQFEQ